MDPPPTSKSSQCPHTSLHTIDLVYKKCLKEIINIPYDLNTPLGQGLLIGHFCLISSLKIQTGFSWAECLFFSISIKESIMPAGIIRLEQSTPDPDLLPQFIGF